MSEAAGFLAAYDAQLRGEAEMRNAVSHDRVGPLWRGRFRHGGFVSYDSLVGYDASVLVEATVAYYRDETDVASFEWKTRGHDDAPGLLKALDAAGFVAEEVETVMVGEAARLAVDVDLPAGVVLHNLTGAEPALLAAATDLQRRVFDGGPDLAGVLERAAGNVEVWVAESDGEVLGCGRLDLEPGTRFGGLWSGATHPDHRGRGLYRALGAARARSAIAHGYDLLQSDCTEMSRPILQRCGLVPVTTTTPYRWTRR